MTFSSAAKNYREFRRCGFPRYMAVGTIVLVSGPPRIMAPLGRFLGRYVYECDEGRWRRLTDDERRELDEEVWAEMES